MCKHAKLVETEVAKPLPAAAGATKHQEDFGRIDLVNA